MAGNEQNEFANLSYKKIVNAKIMDPVLLDNYENYLKNNNKTMQELMSFGKTVKAVDAASYGDRVAQTEHYYEFAVEQTFARMEALGISRVWRYEGDASVSLRLDQMKGMRENLRAKKSIYQVEQSHKKKKRHQEEDARSRAGDVAVASMIQCAGQSASLVGKAYEEKKKNGISDQPISLSEIFALTPHAQSDPQGQADMIANLLIERDKLVEELKQPPMDTILQTAEYRYNKEFLGCIDDAVKTWQATGGYDENGKRVSAMTRKAAQRHLPLAIEKYNYYIKQKTAIIGGYELERVKTSESYQEYYRQVREEAQLVAGRTILGKDLPLLGMHADTVRELRMIISENEIAYEKNKSVIKDLFEEMLQHMMVMSDIGAHTTALQMELAHRRRFNSSYIDDHLFYQSYEQEIHRSDIAGIYSYIRYLLTGRTPEPEQAIYIGQRWHVSIGDLSLDRVPAEKLNLEQRLRDRMNGIENDATMPREYREKANQVYDRFRGSLDTVMGGLNVLEQTTRVALDRVSISNQMKIGQGFDQSAGYRDVVRLAVPFEAEEITLNKKTAAQEGEAATQENEMVTMEGKKATIDFDEIMKLKKALYRVDTGMQYVENRSASGELKKPLKGADCSAAELEADARKVLGVVIEAKKDMDAFRAAHQKAFEPLDVDEAFEHAEILNLFGKKMQPIRDTCSILVTSKAYIGFDEELQKQIKELWDYGAAWMDYVQDRTEFCNLAGYKNLRGLMEEGTDVSVDKLKTTYEECYERKKQEHTNVLNEKRALYTRNSGTSNPDAAAS